MQYNKELIEEQSELLGLTSEELIEILEYEKEMRLEVLLSRG